MSNTTTRVWIGLFMALVFVCGLSLGFAASMWLGATQDPRGFRRPFRPGGPGGPRPFVSERIISELENDPSFTAEQRDRLEALFAERQQRFRAFNREMRERFETARKSLRDDVQAILTPEQMEIFDAARRRDRPRRAPPHDGR